MKTNSTKVSKPGGEESEVIKNCKQRNKNYKKSFIPTITTTLNSTIKNYATSETLTKIFNHSSKPSSKWITTLCLPSEKEDQSNHKTKLF